MKGIFSDVVYTPADGADAIWVLVSTAMVFLMLAGYTLYESGLLRKKNSQFIVVKNVIIACIAAVAWWLCGYGLAYADVHYFIGQDAWYFASEGFEKMAEDNYL